MGGIIPYGEVGVPLLIEVNHADGCVVAPIHVVQLLQRFVHRMAEDVPDGTAVGRHTDREQVRAAPRGATQTFFPGFSRTMARTASHTRS